jgi:hypothetical protein
MQKNSKSYRAVENPVVSAIEKTPMEDLKSFYRQVKAISYSHFRTVKKEGYPLWKCQPWLKDLCIQYLKMDNAQFEKDSLSRSHALLFTKIGISLPKRSS